MEIEKLKQIEMFTDGACSGNPGPGGWGVILRWNNHVREFSGGSPDTTNNQMEMTAALVGFQKLKEPCVVDVFTDSSYLKDGISGWIAKWQKNGWKTAKGDPVKNKELWQAILEAVKPHKVNWHWVKGHSGIPENERCDQLAREAIESNRNHAEKQDNEIRELQVIYDVMNNHLK